jgi:hypothetical protein
MVVTEGSKVGTKVYTVSAAAQRRTFCIGNLALFDGVTWLVPAHFDVLSGSA